MLRELGVNGTYAVATIIGFINFSEGEDFF